jgi:hypothetical protein
MIASLFKALEATQSGVLESVHESLCRFILAIGEQFLSNKHQNRNPVKEYVESKKMGAQLFASSLIFTINRAGSYDLYTYPLFCVFNTNVCLYLEDNVMRRMVLKFLLSLLQKNSQLLFTNDLRVLIDVISRQLDNLEESHVTLRKEYLELLVLVYPQVAPYKFEELKDLLNQITGTNTDEDVLKLASQIRNLIELHKEPL